MRDFSTKVQEASVSRILNAEIGSGCMIDVNDGYARGVSDASYLKNGKSLTQFRIVPANPGLSIQFL